MISWEDLGLDIFFTSDGSVNRKGFEAGLSLAIYWLESSIHASNYNNITYLSRALPFTKVA